MTSHLERQAIDVLEPTGGPRGEAAKNWIASASWTCNSAMLAAKDGSTADCELLFAALYSELHVLARRQLRRRAVPISMSATTLMHRTYINLTGRTDSSFPDSARFIGYVARIMRGLIIDYVRDRRSQKRGGTMRMTSLNSNLAVRCIDRELLLIRDALDELANVDPNLAEVVDLKFFCGFSFAEIAAMRTVSERTIQRAWEKARLYLHQSIRPDLLP